MSLEEFLTEKHIPFECDVDLQTRTWIHRGGVAHRFVSPHTVDELTAICRFCWEEGMTFKLLGHTSNTYIRNTTDLPIVVSTRQLTCVQEDEHSYNCDCGVHIATLAREAIQKGCVGYEGLVNLPGTVASALYNNAGCFGCTVSALLQQAEVLLPNGEVVLWGPSDFGFSERESLLKNGSKKAVILRVWLQKNTNGDVAVLQAKAEANTTYRKRHQEGPQQNLGSTFPGPVMQAFYAHLPWWQRIVVGVINRVDKWRHKRPAPALRDFIIRANHLQSMAPYISKHSLGCFVWRDEKADNAFEEYYSFITQTAKIKRSEIEIL